MNRFGFVRHDAQGQGTYQVNSFANVAHGRHFHVAEATAIQTHSQPPAALWYGDAATRDSEMKAVAAMFPGVMFCPVEITEGIKYQPRAQPTLFDISAKGVLPK